MTAALRPTTGDQPGWPRPRGRTKPTLRSDTQWVLPIPFIAPVDDGGWTPSAYDPHRATEVINHDLCQVCGGPRGATVYGLAPRNDGSHAAGQGRHPQSGGFLCSLRCARLTAAVCPHYREIGPVDIYAVPHAGTRTCAGSVREVDDILDVHAATAELADTVTAVAS